MANGIQNPEEIKEAIKLLDEYIEKFKEFNKVKGEAAAQDASIDQQDKLLEFFSLTAEKRQEQIELMQSQLDADTTASDIKKELLEQEIELHKTLAAIRAEDQEAFVNALDAKTQASLENLENLQKAAQETEGSLKDMNAYLLGITGLLTGVVPSPKEFFTFALALDESRRQLIPYTRTVKDANETHAEFARESARLGIPLTKMTQNLQKAAQEFRGLNMQLPDVQANLGALVGQMEQLGVGAGIGKIIESMVTDQGIDKVEDATKAFKALTLQMRELGVLPNELAKDYADLIPRFAMFGSAATANIAKVSLMSKRAQVDVQAITGFAENFTGYGSAAKAAQTINAVFGKPIIRNPAELVSIFYTSGDAGVMNYVQQKLVESGVDLNPDSPADRAKIVALKSLGFGTEQNVMRLLGDQKFTQEEMDQAGTGITTEGGLDLTKISKEFDDLTRKTVTLSDQFTAVQQNLTLEFMEKIGLDIGTFGEMGDEIAKAMTLSSGAIIETIPYLEEIRKFFSGIGTEVLEKLRELNRKAEETGDATDIVGASIDLGKRLKEELLPVVQKATSEVTQGAINLLPEEQAENLRSVLPNSAFLNKTLTLSPEVQTPALHFMKPTPDAADVERRATDPTGAGEAGMLESMINSIEKTISDFINGVQESNASQTQAPIKVELHLDRSGTNKIAEKTIQYIDKKYAIG